ncbi:MAG: sigma-70 family RNA polymerase sigma factor [Thermogemmata sp.]|nr:sigma-70 family RNA polymerase sigma factor [Thermogemmata sp.]
MSLKNIELFLERAQAGDRVAEDRLFEWVCQRLHAIAARMYRLPHGALFSSSDAVQNACFRLLKLLRQEPDMFQSLSHFLAVAGHHLRWSALELLRLPSALHLESLIPANGDSATTPDAYYLALATHTSPEQLEAWQKFHECIDQPGVLEPEERQVITLRWYHALDQSEIARLMSVSERTVKRYWHNAKEKLRRYVDFEALRS